MITNVSRRDLLKGATLTAGLLLGFRVGFRRFPLAEAAETPSFEPNAFLSIDETGLVTIVARRSEMGTGIRTDLPLVLADELDADWSRVIRPVGSASPACRQLRRRSAMRSTPLRANASGPCRSIRSR